MIKWLISLPNSIKEFRSCYESYDIKNYKIIFNEIFRFLLFFTKYDVILTFTFKWITHSLFSVIAWTVLIRWWCVMGWFSLTTSFSFLLSSTTWTWTRTPFSPFFPTYKLGKFIYEYSTEKLRFIILKANLHFSNLFNVITFAPYKPESMWCNTNKYVPC